MILTKHEFDGVLEMVFSFWNYTFISSRISISGGKVVNLMMVPGSIKITKSGQPDELFTLIDDFQAAYAGVV